MNLEKFSDRFVADENGIWKGSDNSSIFYPEDGNLRCFLLEDTSFWFQHRNECIISAIKGFPPNGPILDVGGGNGYVTRRMIDEGFKAILLEPGPLGAFNAKTQRHIPDVICSTLENAHFNPNSLDAIGLFDIIEHIENDQEFVKHVYSILKPAGLLYITTPAHHWLWSLSDVSAQHFRRYDKEMVVDLLEGKFDILFFTYFFGWLIIPIYFLRVVPFRLGLLRKKNLLDSETEHGASGGITVRILSALLKGETRKIKRQIPQSLGTTCLLVARKRAFSRSIVT
jgi:SAM-dependent methyltransferase